MANKGVLDIYSELPSWSKGVIALSFVAILLFLIFIIYKAFNKKDIEGTSFDIKKINKEIDSFRKKGLLQSYNNSQYDSFADSIYKSMRYLGQDDYDRVEKVLIKMNNDLDVALLIKSFGLRQDYIFGFPVHGKMDMITYLQKELETDWFWNDRVSYINKDWAKKGITYKL